VPETRIQVSISQRVCEVKDGSYPSKCTDFQMPKLHKRYHVAIFLCGAAFCSRSVLYRLLGGCLMLSAYHFGHGCGSIKAIIGIPSPKLPIGGIFIIDLHTSTLKHVVRDNVALPSHNSHYNAGSARKLPCSTLYAESIFKCGPDFCCYRDSRSYRCATMHVLHTRYV
jgi:hypothetical protein